MDSSFAEAVGQPPAAPAPLRSEPARRAVLLGGAGVLLGAAGCAGGGSAGPTAAAPTGSSSTAAPSTASPAAGSPSAAATGGAPAGLPAVTPWVPGPGEVDPDVKLRAVQLVEALGNWPAGGQGVAAAGARAAALGLNPGLAAQAGPLLPAADRAVLQVVYAQYGGLLADSASVMVVCRQWTAGADGTVAEGGTTVDVRLGRAQPRWTVTELHPADPGAPSATLSAAARAVLTDTRILLPPAALADVTSGAVHDSVLRAMLTLAQAYTFQVTVLRSGHPLDVFGTDRPSDHPQGRGVDVWQIDGHTVADPATDHALVDGFMRAAAAAGSYNVGGPRQLSGGVTADQFFSDDTHHDHVHAGFTD
ncbi:hypothetical protein OG689_28130 [Kitasatospora sp. NBC_00240]|uniref:hypothetical protein n=1 Tax=Kitasatospora sp. NBC_00240 TaxID=2903567 RepID=UPI002250C5E3|nr:hypothetical protein [Kitasatospora sp. NBC_00240]MCX5213090.1 hypothetical protein [Kitasatospora sp. NBC_00240]